MFDCLGSEELQPELLLQIQKAAWAIGTLWLETKFDQARVCAASAHT